MQKLAPYRRAVSALEQAGISDQDVDLFIDMKSGKKEAITKFLKDQKFDTLEFDADESSEYIPTQYGRSEQEEKLTEVLGELSKSPVVDRVGQIVDVEWDEPSRTKLIYEHPELLHQLETDVRTGVFDIVWKEAQRRKVLDGRNAPDIDYYADTYQGLAKYISSHPEVLKGKGGKQSENASKQRQARKAATPPRTSTLPTVTQMLNEDELIQKAPSNEEYQKWLKSIGA
jgi:hypothetical protein